MSTEPPAPDHPPRRGGGDRQEHVRVRVRRRHRHHRLRADVPRRGDVRHRPRHPRRDLPEGTPRQRQGVPDHPRSRGSRRRTAVHPAGVPGRPDLRLDPGARPAGQQDQGAQAPQQPAACRSTRAWRSTIGPFTAIAVPGQPLDPGRAGHRAAHAGRGRGPHGRLQVRPHAGRRQADRLQRPRQAERGGRDLPALGLDARREPGLHALRADGRRGVPRDHRRRSRGASSSRPSRATSRASSRCSTRPRRSTARSRSSGARWSRTSGSRPTSAT